MSDPFNGAMIGSVAWHTSDAEDGLPDVGIVLTISDHQELWCGEITRSRHEEAGAEALGPDGGWWIILYEREHITVVGKCLNEEAAHRMIEVLSVALRR